MENVPPGFRFYPTEEELLSFYLHHKLNNSRPDIYKHIPVINIYDFNPWDLPQMAGESCPMDGDQWFFFVSRTDREARGGRPNRLTTQGYWKATGSPTDVYSIQKNCAIGRKRTMVFYVGRAPDGRKTMWKVNEYKAIDVANRQQLREEFSLLRIYKKSKCLRDFDRRPVDLSAMHHRHAESSMDAQELPNVNNDKLNLFKSSSDNNLNIVPSSVAPTTNGNPSNYNGDMAALNDDESLWDDCEQFTWFD